jgi:undecaprenyl-diphosphatase
MSLHDLVCVVFLGLVEGLTEFLPVSSTGHLILARSLIDYDPPGGFLIIIQLGAILAVCFLYFRKLFSVLIAAPTDATARRFILNLVLAFVPAGVVGLLLGGFFEHLVESSTGPWVVSASLILGGLAILVIERVRPASVHHDVDALPSSIAFKIGCAQVAALIPGVSRAGATIMGALLLKVDRRVATEFSFFLAIPTMVAATLYSLYKNRGTLDASGAEVIAIGFVVAFLSALVVVRQLIAFISRHGFGPFAWYRILVGALMLGLLIAH